MNAKPTKLNSHAEWRKWLKLHGHAPAAAGPLATKVLAKLNLEKPPAKPRRRTILGVRSGDLAAAARAASEAGNRRINNWQIAQPVARRASLGEYRDQDEGRYSSRCQWKKIWHTPLYASWVVIAFGGVGICYRWGATGCRTIPAPAGMKFSHDSLGLRLVRSSDGMEYHPTADDLRSRNFAGRIRGIMAANFVARRDAKRAAARVAQEAAIMARELGSVRVTLDDSRKSGNCVEGTLRFAELRLGITREEIVAGGHLFSVSAARLGKFSTAEPERVKAAINRAWMRETAVCI